MLFILCALKQEHFSNGSKMIKVESYIIEAHIFRRIKDNIEFLLLKRADGEIYSGIWQMVTGSVKENEEAYNTALREIKEETSIIPKKFWVVPHINSFYSRKRNSVCMVPVFAALASELDKVTISDEHDEYKWVSADEARKLLAWEGQRKSVDIIEDYFLNRLSTLNFVELTNKL
jgi:dATP pyrophosphohydrolase